MSDELTEQMVLNLALKVYNQLKLPSWMMEDDAHDLWARLRLGKGLPWDGITDSEHRKAFRTRYLKWRLKDSARHRLTQQERIAVNGLSVNTAPRGYYTDDGDERGMESGLISDRGHYARLARNFDCRMRGPAHILATRAKIAEVLNDSSPKSYAMRRVCRALMSCRTLTAARQKARVSDWQFRGILKLFKVRFAQCFQAYRASCRLMRPTKRN